MPQGSLDAGLSGAAVSLSGSDTIDIARLIEERRSRAFLIRLVALSFFIILFDGYDIGAAAFAGPYLVRDWGIANMAELGPIFSASLFGILFGSPLFGWIGDRYGRKVAIIGSCLAFGIFTLAAVLTTSVPQLIFVRFLAGVGIGGLPPNLIALVAEYAPQRFRATAIIVMFSGITLGGALPGPIASWLAPTYGWQILFYIGGILPIIVACTLAMALPESLKFLVVNARPRERIAALVKKIAPEARIDAATRFVLPEEKSYGKFSLRLLFIDGLAPLTLLLWLLFICNQMAFYFTNSWMPTILTTAHVATSRAALATSLFQVGGTIGGLMLSRPIDLFGLKPVALLFLASLPVVGSLGFTTGNEPLLMTMAFLAGFCLLGLQFGINAVSGMLYPTAFRANGSGWAFAVGRAGSVSGPLIGGLLIAMKVELATIFLLLLIPLGIGTIAAIVMAGLYRNRIYTPEVPRTEVPA
jgi:AAHS family 4-hydroxybenzoate transporter-like MFS transporter